MAFFTEWDSFFKSPNLPKNIPNHYPEFKILISCLLLWEGILNFKFRLVIRNIFVWREIWKREPSQITFAFFCIWPRTYRGHLRRTPPSFHFLCSKSSIFLTTYPTLNANVICEGSLCSKGTLIILDLNSPINLISKNKVAFFLKVFFLS